MGRSVMSDILRNLSFILYLCGWAHNATISSVVHPPSDFIITPDSTTRDLLQLPAETSGSETGKTW
jgi:hypothetical protein